MWPKYFHGYLVGSVHRFIEITFDHPSAKVFFSFYFQIGTQELYKKKTLCMQMSG